MTLTEEKIDLSIKNCFIIFWMKILIVADLEPATMSIKTKGRQNSKKKKKINENIWKQKMLKNLKAQLFSNNMFHIRSSAINNITIDLSSTFIDSWMT